MFSDCSSQVGSLGRADTCGGVIVRTVQIDFYMDLLSDGTDFS